MDRGGLWAVAHGVTESDTTKRAHMSIKLNYFAVHT